jgi:L-ascorbate metabolism protein UlaG (beta-lactamase superfamily)
MKTRRFRLLAALGLCVACTGWLAWVHAQTAPQFTGILPLTNKETRLTLTAPVGRSYRIDATTNVSEWSGLVTFPTNIATSLQHTDSAAPYLPVRFYRAAQLTGANIVSGDHLATADGDAIIHPLFHASFVMQWHGKVIYNDPDDDPAYVSTYLGLPKADLVLVSHDHGDHMSSSQIDAVRGPGALIIAPPFVYSNSLTVAQRATAIALTNGASTNVLGMTIEAIPAYNSNHPPGRGNGYVLTLGGKRIYISGDTGDTTNLQALANIDVAFICMNQSFTMNASAATNAVRAFRPKIVYPYHYRENGGAMTNAPLFKQWLGTDLGIEVRLRKWY